MGSVASLRANTQTPKSILEGYLRFRRAMGAKAPTMEQHTVILGKFFRDYPDALESPRECALSFIGGDIAPWTRNTRLKVLRVFFGYLLDEGMIHGEPLRGLRAPMPPKKIDVPPMESVKAILKTLDRKCYAQHRLHTMILLCLETGLRRGEACSLTLGDVDLDRLTVTVRAETTKTGKARLVPLSPAMAQELRKFLRTRPPQWTDTHVFLNETGSAMKPENFTRQVKRLAEKTGIPLHPHALRHLCCTEFLRATGDIALTAKLLGHANIRTTSAFYEHLDDGDLREAARKASILGDVVEQRRVRKHGRTE